MAGHRSGELELIEGWEALIARAPAGQSTLEWLAARTGQPIRAVDWLRRCRNDAAHARALDAAELARALSLLGHMRDTVEVDRPVAAPDAVRSPLPVPPVDEERMAEARAELAELLDDEDPDRSPEVARALRNLSASLNDRGPDASDQALVEAARLVRVHQPPLPWDGRVLGTLLRAVCSHHSRTGRHQQELVVATEQIALSGAMCSALIGTTAESRWRVEHVWSLYDLAWALRGLDRWFEATTTARDAVTASRLLDGDAREIQVLSLWTLVLCLQRTGPMRDGLAMARQLVAEEIELRRSDPSRGSDALARYLHLLAGFLADADEHTAARSAEQEALALRRLADNEPGSDPVGLPSALLSLLIADAAVHRRAGRAVSAELLDLAQEATSRYRDLSRTGRLDDDQIFDAALAMDHLARRQVTAGRHAAAVASYAEQVAVWRYLARTQPRYHQYAADTLHELAQCYSAIGDLPRANAARADAARERRFPH